MSLAVTTEHLLELAKSADLLRATAERAMKADTLERALHAARLEKDAWESQANDHYKDSRTWRDRYDKEVAKNGELLRENETLARNVPPQPPADDSIFWNPYNGAVQDHRDGTIIQPDTDTERAKRGLPPLETEPPVLIGQQWCRTPADSDTPLGFVYLYYTDAMVVRCNVFQSADGTLTYRPLAVRDLPEVSAQ